MTDRNSFGHHSTTDDVLDGIDLSGKRALVTGGASGIGAETVRALAAKGAEVIIAARNEEYANKVKADVITLTGNDKIEFLFLELASLAKIKASADEFLSRFDDLDLLINNAGIMACPLDQTEDGFEMQFGSNHIGHFYFTNLIMPALFKAASSRVISLSSLAHRNSPVVFDDIHYENRPYEKWEAYGQAKTANALFAVGLNKRYADKGVEAFAVHPGVIATRLGRHMTKEDFDRILSENPPSKNDGEGKSTGGMKSVEQGAATTCYAATAPELSGHGGAYLENCHIAEQVPDDSAIRGGIRQFACDPVVAEKLWAVSEIMVGEKFA